MVIGSFRITQSPKIRHTARSKLSIKKAYLAQAICYRNSMLTYQLNLLTCTLKHSITAKQLLDGKYEINKSFSSDVNAAILFKSILGVLSGILLTERDWIPKHPEISCCDCGSFPELLVRINLWNIFGNK